MKREINEKLTINPEPKEVTEMREHILSSFSNLEFIEIRVFLLIMKLILQIN